MSNDKLVSASELAKWLGVKANTLQHLATDGTIPRAARGQYPLRESVTAYIVALRKTVASRNSDQSENRARLLAIQADRQAHKLSQERGEFASLTDVAAAWAAIVRIIRGAVLAVPARVRGAHPGIPPDMLDTLQREIHEALRQAADATFPPEKEEDL